MEYTKPAMTYGQQADLAISRGLHADREQLIDRLKEVGYYRLSGYWHIFKDLETGLFRKGTNIERI